MSPPEMLVGNQSEGEVGHTPGPWSIIPATEYDGDDDCLIGGCTSPAGIEGADGNPVCVFGTSEGSGCLFENEADYHLIAASPELFAVAKDALHCLTRIDEMAHANGMMTGVTNPLIPRLHTAINKALGK